MVAAVAAITLSPRADAWPKRLVVVVVNALAAAGLLSLAVASGIGSVAVPHLIVVMSVQLSAVIIFAAATTPLLKEISGSRLDWALGRQESVFWAAQLAGPPLGGAMTSAFGAEWTLALNAAGLITGLLFLFGVPEQLRPSGDTGKVLLRAGDGLRTIWGTPTLRRLYLNAVMFGTALTAMTPILALFVIRDLGLSAWEYGLVLGVPCLGGLVAGGMAHRWIARVGRERLLVRLGLFRIVWILPLAAIPAGPVALAMTLALQFGLLFTTGLFNPTFASQRIASTPTDRLSAVIASWSATTRLFFPVGIVLAGLVADAFGSRVALACLGVVALVSALPLIGWRNLEGGK